MMRCKRALPGLILAASLVPAGVLADTGLYVGGSYGSAHVDEEVGGLNFDDDASAYRLFGGFQFGETLGIEAGYLDFGDFAETVDLAGIPTRTEISGDGWTLGGTLGLPITDRLSLFGRAGYFFWDADIEVDGFSIETPGDENPYYGGGAKLDIGTKLSLTGDWTRYELDDIDTDVISIGFRYRFGR